MKVVLAGPPRSGKSCLREGLKQAVMALPGAPYPYAITACPDGEGAWFQGTVNADPLTAAACKAAYKTAFSPEFVKRVASSVENCALPLTLIDIGGRTSAENEEICRHASHAIIIAGDMAKVPEWEAFFAKLHITVLAIIWSDYHDGQRDSVPVLGPDGVFRGSVHHLERGEPIRERPTVRALAEILAAMSRTFTAAKVVNKRLRGIDGLQPVTEAHRKLFSTASGKPGELVELSEVLAGDRWEIADELADVTYYACQEASLGIVGHLCEMLGFTPSEALNLAVLKYECRQEKKDKPREQVLIKDRVSGLPQRPMDIEVARSYIRELLG